MAGAAPGDSALVLSGVGRVLRAIRPGQSDRWVLRDIDLSVARGECVAIVGESGVGKSTLMHLIAGLDRPDAGSIELRDGAHTIRIDQLETDDAARLRGRLLGFVFQAFHLIPHLDIQQNIALPHLLSRGSERDARAAAAELLNRLGLGDRLHSLPSELSGGEQQRVALARALVHRPQLVLADEPTGNLDPQTAERALNLLREEAHAAGAAILMVTHSAQAAAGADRTLRLEPGRLVDQTEPRSAPSRGFNPTH